MFVTLVAAGIIALQIFLIIFIIGLVIKAPFSNWVLRNSSAILRLVFAGATLGSLIFEYALGYPPCLLCWYQRLAIIPIAILLFTADITKSTLLRTQVIVISSIGLAIALFHNYIDLFPNSGLDVCGADGVSCLARYVYEFGYITIPMMSLTVLLAGLVFALVLNRRYPQHSLN